MTMRGTKSLSLSILVALWFGCGSNNSGSGSGGPPGDAGAGDGGIADAGGTADGGAADGGDAGTDGGVSADCSGLIPALGPGVSFTTPHQPSQVCTLATSSDAGLVATESHDADAGTAAVNWAVSSEADGGITQTFTASGFLVPVQGGFEGLERGPAGTPGAGHLRLTFFPSGGAGVVRADLGGLDCSGSGAEDPRGGGLVLSLCSDRVLTATRFGADGAVTATANLPFVGSALPLDAFIDTKGNALILLRGEDVALAVNAVAGQWLGTGATPSGAPFMLGTVNGDRTDVLLRGAIGGGVFFLAHGVWTSFVPSGQGNVAPAPDWLAKAGNVRTRIIRGGKGYAALPRAGTRNSVTVYSASGANCGAVTFPVDSVEIGGAGDESAIGGAGEGGCSRTVWSALFK